MRPVFYVVIILFLLTILLYTIRVPFKVVLTQHNKKGQLQLYLRFFGYQIRLRAKKKKMMRKDEIVGITALYHRIQRIKSAINLFRDSGGHLYIRFYRLEMKAGVEDAFWAGQAIGWVWALAGMIDAFLMTTFKVKDRIVIVHPVFGTTLFKGEFECIFSMRIVHIITIAARFGWGWLKQRRKAGGGHARASD